MSKSNSDGKPIRHYQFNRSLEAKARKSFAERLGASRVELALYYLRFYGLTIRETVAYVQGTTTLHAIRRRVRAAANPRPNQRRKQDALRDRLPGSFDPAVKRA